MRYVPVALPFRVRSTGGDGLLAVSASGDHLHLSIDEVEALRTSPDRLPLALRASLQSRFFLATEGLSRGQAQLLASRIAAKRETVRQGPSLHILVPTLRCGHSCRYCQVSRALADDGHTLSESDLDAACDSIFESASHTLTVEFQGGDPLVRFDLIERAVRRIHSHNLAKRRSLRFVVASTLHQLTPAMCQFFKAHGVYLSTSIDGPAALHNRNRPVPGRDAYERTVAGIELARAEISPEAVSALMTTTKESLSQPEAIVDEYVRLGFRDIFIRPLSAYGFAKRNQSLLAYDLADFFAFYERALDRVVHWNRRGVELREVYASILLNKILSPFDGGYVDLQSPTGAGNSVLVYNYDGYVYPSDEARMLAETGDRSFRMGRIGVPLDVLLDSDVARGLQAASRVDDVPGCRECAYQLFCAPNPVDAQAQFGHMQVPVGNTEHCQRHTGLFDRLYERVRLADDGLLELFHQWAAPVCGASS